MVPATEAERIERVLQGDRAAFVALFDEHLPALWRGATQLCDERAAAEALVRAVFTKAFRQLAERPAGLGFADWLAALARELAPPRRAPALRAPGAALHADA